MRTLILLLVGVAAHGAIGDQSPSVPSTYVATHPRLGAPDSTYLTALWAARPTGYGGTNGAARFWTDADAWSGASVGLSACRRLLIAYQAEKANSGPRTATYLAKIAAIPTTNTTGMGAWAGGICAALAYDWTYADLDATGRSDAMTYLQARLTAFEGAYSGSSPYNDQFYITGGNQTPFLTLALAQYSPSIAAESGATSLTHLRWAMDVFFNALLPTWKQAMGSECGASTDSDITCGGMWHESWEYVNQANGLDAWYVMTLLSWKNASGSTSFFTTNGWIKNYAYWMMYQVRPDWVMEPLMAVSRPIFTVEYDGPNTKPGSLDGLAAIYSDPTLRGWSRAVNWGNAVPDGFEPSAWPFYAPDSSLNSVNTRASLAKVKDFPGEGTIFFRTGWTESDAFCTLRYGDSFWSHPVQDTGAWTCFNRGPLAIRSGSYRPGSDSPHFQFYAGQAISQNVITVMDASDTYASEGYTTTHNDGTQTTTTIPNDGGFRRVGSTFGNVITTGKQASPFDPGMWKRDQEYYRQGRLLAYTVGTSNAYAYAAVDTTRAYNNLYSRNAHTIAKQKYEANTSNRSYRVRTAVRHFLFIPRGTAAYVVVYDQIESTNSAFTKSWLIHSINQPTVVGSAYTIVRDELITSLPFSNLWPQKWAAYLANDPSSSTYQYDGKLYGWATFPAVNITSVGGPGSEFLIGATNYKECGKYGGTDQCPANTEGLGSVLGEINPVVAGGPHQPGSWRLEIVPSVAAKEDRFTNVMLVTSKADTNAVSTTPSTSLVGTNYVTTWKDNADTCTYTVTLPKYGVGGTVTAIGAGCATVIN